MKKIVFKDTSEKTYILAELKMPESASDEILLPNMSWNFWHILTNHILGEIYLNFGKTQCRRICWKNEMKSLDEWTKWNENFGWMDKRFGERISRNQSRQHCRLPLWNSHCVRWEIQLINDKEIWLSEMKNSIDQWQRNMTVWDEKYKRGQDQYNCNDARLSTSIWLIRLRANFWHFLPEYSNHFVLYRTLEPESCI